MRRPSLLLLAVLVLTGGPVFAESGTGTVTGTVTLESTKSTPLPPGYKVHTKNPVEQPDTPRAIVYLEREDGVYPTVAARQVFSIGQQGYQFRPGIAAVQTGGQVSFPNRDEEFHNVFSYSRAKRFDLGRFRMDETSPPVTFDKAGLVKIYCEIHKHMRNLLLVLDTPWFTVTDASGAFELVDVPPGDYRVKAYLPADETLESRVSVAVEQTVQINLAR